ncbi:MAG: hypothetical protein ABEI39_02655 [Halobacteriales archaeon]
MNLEDLRDVQDRERRSDSLGSLRDSFYRDVAEYIEELRAERERAAERAEDPFSSEEVRRLTDEIETAEEVAEAIYERRVGKVVERASLAAADMPIDEEGLTDEERTLFSDLVGRIETHREEVIEAIAGEADLTPEDGPGEELQEGTPATDGTTLDAGAAMGTDPEDDDGAGDSEDGDDREIPPERPSADGGTVAGTASTPEEADDHERVTVRITREVGEILGIDEQVYDLAPEDVVTLPATNAEPLLERGAAERI